MQDAGISSCMSNFSVVDPSILFLFFCAGDELIIDYYVNTKTRASGCFLFVCLFVVGAEIAKIDYLFIDYRLGPAGVDDALPGIQWPDVPNQMKLIKSKHHRLLLAQYQRVWTTTGAVVWHVRRHSQLHILSFYFDCLTMSVTLNIANVLSRFGRPIFSMPICAWPGAIISDATPCR